jgi:flagellar motor switch protein FliG
MIQEEIQYMGPVKLRDVEECQQKIVDVVRRLEDSGEIVLSGRGGDDEIVV